MATSTCLFTNRCVWCLVAMLWLSLAAREASARPPWLASSGVFTDSAQCHTDDELLDLCQRCAKLTKSRLAYPACCSTDLQARNWCSDYVYFGRDKFDYSLL